MKRDMDLVRAILRVMEDAPSGFAPQTLQIEGATDEQVGYHVFLMQDAGLLVAQDVTNSRSSGPCCVPMHLTWEGHEFLDATKDEEVWAKAKGAMARAGGFAFDVLKGVLIALATAKAKASLGL